MSDFDPLAVATVTALVLPWAAFVVLGSLALQGRPLGERGVARVASASSALSLLAILVVAIGILGSEREAVVVDLGRWFEVDQYAFEFILLLDGLSLPFAMLTTMIGGLVGLFSVSYMHREPGYLRFYALLSLFTGGMLLLVMGGNIDLLFAGWEVVGLTSALLIGFFHTRADPVRNGLRTFAIYRTCDVALLVGAVMVHHFAHSADLDHAFGAGRWPGGLSHVEGFGATTVGLLLMVAAMGKSAQVPFSSWLPRAMEGPTPSSAIFYGALSIHAGAYLLLRASPMLERSAMASVAVVAVGTVGALHGTLVGRVQSDVKTGLAYAAMTQVGLIWVEIGLGWHRLALLHVFGHTCVRTLQFLRAPSALHDFHGIAAKNGDPAPTGVHFELLLPERLRCWLYRQAFDRGLDEVLLDRFVLGPTLGLARLLDAGERAWFSLITRVGSRPAASPARTDAGRSPGR